MAHPTIAKVLAILPKFTGALSFFGSLCIIHNIVKVFLGPRKPSSLTFHRIMLGLSCFDVISSVGNILSTWPTPRDLSQFVYLASGSTQTCTAQGFFNELGNVGAVLYSVSLSMHYLWQISTPGVRSRLTLRQEVWLHVVPMIVALGMAVVGLPFTLYNNAGWTCWYAPYPWGCDPNGDPNDPNSIKACTRGSLSEMFRWIHFGIVWGAILAVTVSMLLIFRAVWLTEKKANKIRSNTSRFSEGCTSSSDAGMEISNRSNGNNSRKKQSMAESLQIKMSARTKRVALQALLYIGSLYLTWIFTSLLRIFQTAKGVTHKELLVLMALFWPMQGFFNALIYFRSQRSSTSDSSPSGRSSYPNSAVGGGGRSTTVPDPLE